MKEIPLANGKGVALVDDEDYELVSRYKWWMASYRRRPGGKVLHYAKAWYKDEQGNRSQMSMHRFLMKPGDGMEVDHRDNNGLNNQSGNLRVCDRTLNQFNTRPTEGNPYKGVEKKRDRYSARIKFGGVRHNLGCFETAEEAAIAYDMKAYELAGEFAYLNFPDIVHETLKKEAENEQEKE